MTSGFVIVNTKNNVFVEDSTNKNGSKSNSLPQTGDATNHLGLWLGLMFVSSGSILLGLNHKKRKIKKER